jgi:hypothetical protein
MTYLLSYNNGANVGRKPNAIKDIKVYRVKSEKLY